MHLRDPKDLSQSSQSLDDEVNFFDGLYKNSPLPACIRDQYRKIIYANAAFSRFFSPQEIVSPGDSYDPHLVELRLSSIELESLSMGVGTAICQNFNCNGENYQIRVEPRLIGSELYSFWLINFFPDYQAIFSEKKVGRKIGFDINVFFAELSTKVMVVLCFSILGFHPFTISRILGITERAVNRRLDRAKYEIFKSFSDYDEFKLHCLKSKGYEKAMSIVLLLMNVNDL